MSNTPSFCAERSAVAESTETAHGPCDFAQGDSMLAQGDVMFTQNDTEKIHEPD